LLEGSYEQRRQKALRDFGDAVPATNTEVGVLILEEQHTSSSERYWKKALQNGMTRRITLQNIPFSWIFWENIPFSQHMDTL